MIASEARPRSSSRVADTAGRAFSGFALVACLAAVSGCQESTAPAASHIGGDVAAARSSTGTAGTTTVPSATTSTSPPAVSTDSTSKPVSAATTTTSRPRPVIAGRGGVRDITFDNVKLNMKKGDPYNHSLITPEIEKLDGAKVRVRGYILPPFQQTGLTRFVLVRDNMSCCFGPGAMIFDSMIVELKPGLTIDYTIAPVTVEGVFNLRENEVGGRIMSIYHVAADKVQ